MTKAGRLSGPSASGSLRKTTDCGAGGKGALQRLADEGVLVGAEVAGAGALGVLADGGQVQNVGIAGDEIFEQAGDLRSAVPGRRLCRAGR